MKSPVNVNDPIYEQPSDILARMSTPAKFVLFALALIAALLALIARTRHEKQEEFHNKITALTTELATRQSNKEDVRRLIRETMYQRLILRDGSSSE